ncbi:MAG: prepilin-type N-terminal cleavage/methylation domain-containing protein, partial [Campylobacterota bacterium]|nr:prepilin-type N-terminal cleavage/methylation domain-containing protein [Campylobacterota bacterium]
MFYKNNKKLSQKYTLTRAFSLIELIFVVAIISVIISQSIPNYKTSKLNSAANKMILYLNYTRYITHIDNKHNINDEEWFMKRWTLKFQNCSADIGGLYYVVYSDMSGNTAHFKKEDCLKDPLTNKYLYSGSSCDTSSNENKYIQLTKEYDIQRVELSCNSTSSIGQISFGYDGKIYSKLS